MANRVTSRPPPRTAVHAISRLASSLACASGANQAVVDRNANPLERHRRDGDPSRSPVNGLPVRQSQHCKQVCRRLVEVTLGRQIEVRPFRLRAESNPNLAVGRLRRMQSQLGCRRVMALQLAGRRGEGAARCHERLSPGDVHNHLRRDRPRPQNLRNAVKRRNYGRFDAEPAGSAVQHGLNSSREIRDRMVGCCRTHHARPVGGRSRNRTAEPPEKFKRHLMGRNSNAESAVPRSGQIADRRALQLREHKGKRPRPKL